MVVRYDDGWTVTVETFGEQKPGPVFKAPAGTRFVVVTVRLNNGAQKGLSVSTSEFKLQDASGVRHSASYLCPQCRSDLLGSVELGPGGSIAGAIVFEAPVGDARVSLVYERFFYQEVIWELF